MRIIQIMPLSQPMYLGWVEREDSAPKEFQPLVGWALVEDDFLDKQWVTGLVEDGTRIVPSEMFCDNFFIHLGYSTEAEMRKWKTDHADLYEEDE